MQYSKEQVFGKYYKPRTTEESEKLQLIVIELGGRWKSQEIDGKLGEVIFCGIDGIHVSEDGIMVLVESTVTDPLPWKHPEDPVPQTATSLPNDYKITESKGDAFKYDGGKIRMDLLPLPVLEKVAEVMQWAVEVKGYTEGSWANVPDGERRYQAACLRHSTAIQKGERFDDESKLLHAAHKACCALFELHYAINGESDGTTK